MNPFKVKLSFYHLIIICFIAFFVLYTLLVGRTHGSAPTQSPITHHAPRYISLAPATTEILFALGLTDNIVGVSTYCDYPPEALAKPKVGSFSEPNLETIVEFKPDLVFGTDLAQGPAMAKLQTLKIKVYTSAPKNLEELYTSILEIGQLTDRTIQAKNLVKNMRDSVTEITKRTTIIPQNQKPKIFVEIGENPLITAGKGSFIDELITLAGGINIAHEVPRPYCYYNIEQVIKGQPDYIIITDMQIKKSKASSVRRFGWESVPAVKKGQVYNDLDPNILLRPGPRLVEGLEEIYKKIKIPLS